MASKHKITQKNRKFTPFCAISPHLRLRELLFATFISQIGSPGLIL